MKMRWLVILVCLLLAPACGGAPPAASPELFGEPGARTTFYVDEVADPGNLAPERVRAVLLSHLKEDLEGRGVLAAERAGASRLVKVTISSYRLRTGVARFFSRLVGARDGMVASVCLLDPATGGSLSEEEVACYQVSSTGGEEEMARSEATEIARYLTGRGQ